MNVLNRPAVQPNQAAPASRLYPVSLFPKGSVFTVIGRVHKVQPGWAGRVECSLALSIGDMPVRANRSTLPIHIGNGSWIRAKLMHPHAQEDGGPVMHVLSAVAVPPAPGETSWVPVSLYHRNAGMRELRRLLSTLAPGLQGLFMSLMLDRVVQRNFFWRPAASDHHCYPGGLFDQCVAAAGLAHQGPYAGARDRGLATMASLLWDIGKVSDPRLQEDRTRGWPELQPHVTTALRLKRPLARLALSEPLLADALGALLASATETHIAPITHRTAYLRRRVHQAVHDSWGPAESFLDTDTTKPGAEA